MAGLCESVVASPGGVDPRKITLDSSPRGLIFNVVADPSRKFRVCNSDNARRARFRTKALVED
jgi:hypothetical protein